MANLQSRFSDSERERIKAAVRAAESAISGEIVPVIVSKSGYYTIANYKSSLIAATAGFFILILLERYVPAVSGLDILVVFPAVLLFGVIGAIVPNFSDGFKRMLITNQHMEHATRQRAENAFLEQEVFNTRHRTGIMIFISFFENEVIVMADRGISKVVDQKAWDKIVNDLTEQVRKGKIVEGLEIAIKKCGEILAEKGFNNPSDDVNELRDDLRIE